MERPQKPSKTSAPARRHAREIAAQGYLLRLWRPPLQPGEWRTLGLFATDGDDQLKEVLASMPLRMWRTDEVTRMTPHGARCRPSSTALCHPADTDWLGAGRTDLNQPQTEAKERAVEFLTTLTITVPEGTPGQTVDDTKAREAQRAHELTEQGHSLRLWTPPAEPGQWPPRCRRSWSRCPCMSGRRWR
ncbi:MAG: hypothetical protein JO063_15605 [Pseudonocardiales bacterium]|nr:hypothetical protein [Pseudonocardiales bacterium]MBV9031604.1 hypothetical protein [Pseudonocardiales bacterium]MBW0011512.1 hypothetical protein [Pseudonocardiales bacterium]